MIHYHVWFNLKPEIPASEGLATVHSTPLLICSTGRQLPTKTRGRSVTVSEWQIFMRLFRS